MKEIIIAYIEEMEELVAADSNDYQRMAQCLEVMQGIWLGNIDVWRCDVRVPELKIIECA